MDRPGEKEALVGRGLLNAPLPPVSGAWCGRLRLECLGRAEAAGRNMAAAHSPNLFILTLCNLHTLTRLSMTHWIASLGYFWKRDMHDESHQKSHLRTPK